MPITMQGSWDVEVKAKNAAYEQRFIIEGSDNADGTYEGKVGSGPGDTVRGQQWTISIEHRVTKNSDWIPSAERLTRPMRSSGNITFDILSNDSGSDKDYNDLIVKCETEESPFEHVVYGRVRSYFGLCKFNPCFPGFYVIDSLPQFRAVAKFKEARQIIESYYPGRLRELEQEPPEVKAPFPEPGPEPFRPMMIPVSDSRSLAGGTSEAVPTTSLPTLTTTRAITRETQASTGTLSRAISSIAAGPASVIDKSVLAKVKDRFKPFCKVEDQPGLLLRFLEYDRTSDELAGGAYSGDGDRQILGYAVTDELGNYLFRFSRSLEDIVDELDDIDSSGTPLATQLRPDVIVQVVSGIGEDLGVLYESALFSDIPNIKRINLCIPKDQLEPGPAACQGMRAIQSIGNVWTLPGMGNTLDAEGRITATHPNGPIITRGAWAGRLHMFACFLDQPTVTHYTIRYRRPGGSWAFVEQFYKHGYIPKLGDPNDPAHKVGPFDTTLNVDGSPQEVPAYKNIENDGSWVAVHRLRKIILNSGRYAPNTNPGTVEFWLEGYDGSGNKVAAADDKILLYIDNKPVKGDIASIAMGGVAPGECALFELPTPNEPLTIRFRADQAEGFMQHYHLQVLRGSGSHVDVSDTIAPVQPLSVDYHEPTHGNYFYGTFDAVSPDVEGYVVAELQPTGGAWLPPGKDFCAFAFEVYGKPRVTDGYSVAVGYRLAIELVGLQLPSGP